MNQSNQKQKKINVFCYLTVKDKSTPRRAYSQTVISCSKQICRIQGLHHDKSKNFVMKNNNNCKKVPENI